MTPLEIPTQYQSYVTPSTPPQPVYSNIVYKPPVQHSALIENLFGNPSPHPPRQGTFVYETTSEDADKCTIFSYTKPNL